MSEFRAFELNQKDQTMHKSAIIFLFLLSSHFIFAQTQGIAYTAVGKGVATSFLSDYHCIGINASALGWEREFEKKRFTMGTSEFGFGIYSNALTANNLRGLYNTLRNQATGSSTDQATRDQQRQFAKDFTNSDVLINVNYNWFGASFQNEKLGGIALSVSDSYQWESKLGARMSDLMFNGKYASIFDSLTVVFGNDTTTLANSTTISQDTLSNVISGNFAVPVSLSYLAEGTRIKSQWTRSYNLSYGRKIFGRDNVFVLYGGIGARYIQAIAMFDMESNGSSIQMNSALSPSFNIDYSSISSGSPSFSGTNQRGFPPKGVGTGYGLDFSLSAKLFKKITLAAAVNNIGQIRYKRNVFTVNDTLIGSYSVAGIDSDNITQAVNSLLQDGGLLNIEGEQEFSISNPATFRVGVSIKFGKILNVGFDFVAPFDRENPGSISNPVFAFGGEVRPLRWLALSAGYFGGGIYKNNIPVGINFILGKGTYEFGVSSRDMLSFFMQESNSVSLAMGFMRFRF